jgi:hypothetical protein
MPCKALHVWTSSWWLQTHVLSMTLHGALLLQEDWINSVGRAIVRHSKRCTSHRHWISPVG